MARQPVPVGGDTSRDGRGWHTVEGIAASLSRVSECDLGILVWPDSHFGPTRRTSEGLRRRDDRQGSSGYFHILGVVAAADADCADDRVPDLDGIATAEHHEAVDAGGRAHGQGRVVLDEVVPGVGGQSEPGRRVGMSWAIWTDSSAAPSIRLNALRMPLSSTTAITNGWPISAALRSAASIITRASSAVTLDRSNVAAMPNLPFPARTRTRARCSAARSRAPRAIR